MFPYIMIDKSQRGQDMTISIKYFLQKKNIFSCLEQYTYVCTYKNR